MSKTAIRTDLAIELNERRTGHAGIEEIREEHGGVTVTRIKITNGAGERALGRPKGNYVTVEFGDILSPDERPEIKKAVKRELKNLLPQKCETVLAVGLGNPDITPDSIGPLCARRIFATEHISHELAAAAGLDGIRGVAVIAPGVTGQTGLETGRLITATASLLSPDAVIVTDALAARSRSRLFKTVQLCDTGIAPGSGVSNSRKEISRSTTGVPVIAVGVPTVIDTDTLIEELTGLPPSEKSELFVTPKEVDLLSRRAAELLADVLNSVLQPNIELEKIYELL